MRQSITNRPSADSFVSPPPLLQAGRQASAIPNMAPAGDAASGTGGGGGDGNKPAMDHFVSQTALLVCAHRVHESRRPDALFKDPLAEIMVPEVSLLHPSGCGWLWWWRSLASIRGHRHAWIAWVANTPTHPHDPDRRTWQRSPPRA